MILVDNRPGEPTSLPLDIPAGTIADLDGARLRDFLASVGGSAAVRFSFTRHELHPGRGGTIMFFSSAGPTAFGHLLKPDVSAPGGEILSSTLAEFAQAPFASFDGTSMATPHVAGAAALLLQRHPGWTTAQVRSALVSTAGPVWADTAQDDRGVGAPRGRRDHRHSRAPTTRRSSPTPSALSFGDLNANRGAVTKPLVLERVRCGWRLGNLDRRGQARSPRRAAPRSKSRRSSAWRPAGDALLPVAATASASAPAGDNFGFLVLRRGTITRRIPYAFFVTRPALEGMTRRRRCAGSRTGRPRAGLARQLVPLARRALRPSAELHRPADDRGRRRAACTSSRSSKKPVVNFGVGVVGSSPERDHRSLAARLARRERRPGRDGHADERQSR